MCPVTTGNTSHKSFPISRALRLSASLTRSAFFHELNPPRIEEIGGCSGG